MSGIVVLSGDTHPDSRTARLATGIGTSTAQLIGARPPEVIDLAEYGYRLLVPDAEEVSRAIENVRDADLLEKMAWLLEGRAPAQTPMRLLDLCRRLSTAEDVQQLIETCKVAPA